MKFITLPALALACVTTATTIESMSSKLVGRAPQAELATVSFSLSDVVFQPESDKIVVR